MSEHDVMSKSVQRRLTAQGVAILTIPRIPPSLNVCLRMNRHKLQREHIKPWHLEMKVATQGMEPFTKFPLKVTLQLRCNIADTDNTIMAVKFAMDGLKYAGMIPDDSKKYIGTIVLLPPQSGWDKDETKITIAPETIIKLAEST